MYIFMHSFYTQYEKKCLPSKGKALAHFQGTFQVQFFFPWLSILFLQHLLIKPKQPLNPQSLLQSISQLLPSLSLFPGPPSRDAIVLAQLFALLLQSLQLYHSLRRAAINF